MKNKYILALVPLLGLVACGTINNNDVGSSNDNNQIQINEVLLKELQPNEVLVNLTVNGLYNGEKGDSSSDYNLENYKILELNVGDTLPTKDTITSTVEDVEFTSWQYVNSEGELLFTDTVQEGQKYYQAYFTYLGEGEEDIDYGTGGQLSSEAAGEPRMIYAKLNVDWSKVNIYLWTSSGASYSAWPGTEMTVVDAANKIYGFEVQSHFKNVIFNDGASQTSDLAIYDNVNIYTINATNNVSFGWYENGIITPVEIEVQLSSDFYVIGSMSDCNWGWVDKYRLTLSEDGNSASGTFTFTSGTQFKITSGKSWDVQFNYSNITPCDGIVEGNENQNIKVNTGGSYTITVNGIKSGSLSVTITKA